jgi:hypothetical protein
VSQAPKSDHNPIFSRFVQANSPDSVEKLEGLVAYGLYKSAKREWAEAIWEREKRKPTHDELAAYISAWTPALLQGKEHEARAVLAAYADAVVEAAKPGIREEAFLAALKGNIWKVLGIGLLTNLIYTVFLIAIVLVLQWAGVDLLGLMEKLKPVR